MNVSQKIKNHLTQKAEEGAVMKAVKKALVDKDYYIYRGNPNVTKFEAMLSDRLMSRSVIGTNSGTDALVLSLKALGIGPGDEVIVPSFSFISSASSISWVGATPIFVDISEEDFALSATDIEKKITTKTRAILIVHLFGQPSLNISDIAKIAKTHNLFLIEDAAQSFGAKVYHNGTELPVGTIGDVGCFSFAPTKLLSAPGNGGAIVVNKEGLEESLRILNFYGAKELYYDYPLVGINCKLQEIQAAALSAKLPFLDYWFEYRSFLANLYQEHLSDITDIILPHHVRGTERVWYRYIIRVKKDRDKLLSFLKGKFKRFPHLQPMVNYPIPLPYLTAFNNLGHSRGDFPVSEQLSQEVLSIPIHNIVQPEEVVYICKTIKEFFS